MVSITLSVPPEIKGLMDEFTEMNWSGFIRKQIVQKAKEIKWREEILKRLKKEENLNEWAVSLQKKHRKGRFQKLKKKGLV